MAWYSIHVMTGREDIVCEGIREHLEKEGYAEPYKLFVVKRELLERRCGEYATVFKVMFPGYVLVESEDIQNLVNLTQNHKGVFRYLTNGSDFSEVDQWEMAKPYPKCKENPNVWLGMRCTLPLAEKMLCVKTCALK
jgi:transcription antitermination factor NusG